MARLAKERAARIEKTAETIGGTEDNNTGAGPSHWYENYNPKNSRPWMVLDAPDYQVPPTTQEAKDRAAALKAARGGGDGYYTGPFRGPEEFTAYVRCITRGVPGSMMPAIYGNSYDITQSPGYVAIRYEMVHETRVIPLDNRPAAGNAFKSYMGEARGHFEGDTLVVVTTNYKEAGTYGGASSALKTTEWFKPTGPNTVDWSIKFEDPHTWTKPWSFGMLLTRDPQSQVFDTRATRATKACAACSRPLERLKRNGSWELDFGSWGLTSCAPPRTNLHAATNRCTVDNWSNATGTDSPDNAHVSKTCSTRCRIHRRSPPASACVDKTIGSIRQAATRIADIEYGPGHLLRPG